ncbi:SHOCT domain-containing protein [Pontibacter saemangeumensis]
MDDDFWVMHWFWWMFWIIVAIIIFAFFWYIRSKRTSKETPLDILKRRYAAGEIDTAEYNIRKRELEKGS